MVSHPTVLEVPSHHQRMNRAQTPWLFLAALLVPLPTFAATVTGKVVKVADGDTITILVGTAQHRIRLQGIDAPERKQPFGRASSRSLSALVAGKQARGEYGVTATDALSALCGCGRRIPDAMPSHAR